MGKAKKLETKTPKKAQTSELESKQSGLVSRCSPQYFMNIIAKIKVSMGLKHVEALKKTPFYHFFEMTQQNPCLLRVEALLKRFNVNNFSFRLGKDIEVPFAAADFSIVLGLHQKGQGVDESLRMPSSTVDRLFGGKYGNVKRKDIGQKIEDIVKIDDDDCLDDFCRLYILLVFNCLLFPTSNYWTPRFLLPYVDDLSRIGLYAWGEATYNFLVNEIRQHLGEGGEKERKKYLDGCTVGLMGWLYERVPSLGTQTSLYSFPRFTRWGESRLPNNEKSAEEKLAKITREKILAILPTPEEQGLVDPIVTSVSTSVVPTSLPCDLEEMKMLLKAKDDEIQSLKQRLLAFHDEEKLPLEGKRGREEDRMDRTEKTYKRRRLKKMVVKTDEEMAEEPRWEESSLLLYLKTSEPLGLETEELGKNGEKETEEKPEGKPENEIKKEYPKEEEKEEEEKEEEEKEDEEQEDEGKGRENDDNGDKEDNGGDEAEKNEEEHGEEERKEEGGEGKEGKKEDMCSTEKEEGGKEKTQAEKFQLAIEEGVGETGAEEKEEVEGLDGKEEEDLAKIMSSIAQSVHNRDDRIPKKKDEDFVTPPTCTPEPKRPGRGRGRGRRGGRTGKV